MRSNRSDRRTPPAKPLPGRPHPITQSPLSGAPCSTPSAFQHPTRSATPSACSPGKSESLELRSTALKTLATPCHLDPRVAELHNLKRTKTKRAAFSLTTCRTSWARDARRTQKSRSPRLTKYNSLFSLLLEHDHAAAQRQNNARIQAMMKASTENCKSVVSGTAHG